MTRLPKEHEWIRSSPIAHRGLHKKEEGRPENSLAAFDYARKNGFPIELDVRLARDLEVVVIHDRDLLRLTEHEGNVEKFTSRELSELPIENSDQCIPSLREVLELVSGRVPILVEIKSEGRVGVLEEQVLKLLQSYSGLVALQSFNPFSLRYIRVQAPNAIRGQLSGTFKPESSDSLNDPKSESTESLSFPRKVLLRNLALNGLSRPHFIGYQREAFPSAVVGLYRRIGVPVVAWTIRKPEEWEVSRRFADNFIFERFLP